MRTTSVFVADVRRQLMLPNSATTGTQDADLLAIADQEMQARLLPVVTSPGQEYNGQMLDVALIPGQRQYRFPPRSAASKLRDIRFVLGTTVIPLPKIEIEQVQGFLTNTQGNPQGFFIQAGSINLCPIPGYQGTLRCFYYANHKTFVSWAGTSDTTAGVIAAPTYSQTVAPNDTITFTTSTFAPVVGRKYDIISANQPFEALVLDAVCTSAGATYTLQAPAVGGIGPCVSMSPNIQAGDLVVPAGNVPVIQLPDEAYQMLVTRVCINIAMQIGDAERVAIFEKMYDNQYKDFFKLVAPRVEGAPAKMSGSLQSTFNTTRWWTGLGR